MSQCNILWRQMFLALASLGVVPFAVTASASPVSAGYRETVGIAVAAGVQTALTERVALSADGRFIKAGDGTLTLPVSAVDSSVSPTVHVLGGTLALTATSLPTADASTPSEVIARKAAFWVDAANGQGLVATNGESSSAYAARWCDRRETNLSAPTMWYAEPWWTNSTSSALWGVPPSVQTVDGRRTVFFGGKNSSQCMLFCKDGKTAKLSGVRDVFLVIGVTNCLGLVLGHYGDPGSPFFNTEVETWPVKRFHYPRNDVGVDSYVARFYLDGMRFDPFTVGPKRGFQLYERHHVEDIRADTGAMAFFTGYSDKKSCEGGDYLCEAVIFTNRLTEVERLDVRRYLMAKWGLPHVQRTETPMQRNYATFATSSNATVEVTVDGADAMDDIRLSGEGTLVKKGSGTLTLGPSDAVPFSGTLNLEDGAVATRGGRIPSVRLASGTRLTSREVNTSSAAPDTSEGQSAAATTVTMHGDAGDGTVVKDGAGPARVRSIASDVKRLKVTEGQLVLDSGNAAHTFSPASAVSATIPNHDFEQRPANLYRGDAPYAQSYRLDAASGWTALNGASDAVVLTSVPSSSGDKWGTWCSHPCPQGTNVLYLISNAGAYTTVTFPADGYYQGSVLASVRWRDDEPKYSPVDVFLGTDLSSTNVIGTVVGAMKNVGAQDFRRYYFRTPYVEAGKAYVFGVKSREKVDAGIALDDFRLDLIPDGESQQAAYKIPNGDFEQIGPIAHMWRLTNGCTVAGWTFCDWLVKSVPAVAVALPSTICGSGRLFSAADVVWNSVQMALASNSWIETTFTPPAGTYWLRGRMADWPANWEGTTLAAVGATIRATVTRSGTTIELGSQVASSHMLSGCVWPNAFTVDGAMPVTLRIEQAGNNSVALVDDFELVAAMTDELLADTSTEDKTKWNPLNPAAPKLVPDGAQSGYLRDYDGIVTVNSVQEPFVKYWGHNRFVGDRYIFLAQNGGMQQAVTIPQSGIYRLTYHERSRVTPSNGGNPVRAWIRSEDGSYTNFISKSTRYICTNFVEHSFMFNMPSAGRYVLAFQGTGYNWMTNPKEDLEALVDGVSLKHVAQTPTDVPDVPARMRISVSEGAMLALDFPGTIHTGTVTLGGRRVVGRIDSSTHPDFICGMGAIEARPEGAVIVIR